MSAHSSPARAGRRVAEESGSGPSIGDIGVVTQEYVNTPYGIARIVLPFEPRTDGVVVVQLPWATAYVSEECISRIDDYRKRAAEAERAAKLAQHALAKKAKSTSPDGQDVAAGAVHPADVVGADPYPQFPAFAPLKVPLYRRRQTLALTVSSFFSLICCVFSLLLVRTNGWVLYAFLAYFVWMLLFQDYHKNGRGFKSNWFRSGKWWHWFRDYFPISLHATAPLDPKGKYIFCYHPHGILSLGAFLNFGSEATGFAQKFPGIDLRLLTLTNNFRIPFYGFFLSLMGIADASRESCNNCLSRGPGSAILLVLGGAKESLDAHPHRDYELTLHRKGFVKVALENQADLVPIFSFGETDVWDQVDNPRGSTLRKIQEKLQQRLGFAFPLVKGRGIFNYKVGLLPHRRPITTFVGPPVVLPKVDKKDITDALINEYHEKYKAALVRLFDTYKGTFAPHRKLYFVGGPKPKQAAPTTKQVESEPSANAQLASAATTHVNAPVAEITQADSGEEKGDSGSTLTKRR